MSLAVATTIAAAMEYAALLLALEEILPGEQWRLVAGLFGAAFLLQVGATYASYASLEKENLQLRRQIETTYRQVVPKGAVVDAEKQLEQQLSQLRGGGQAITFVGMMERIARVVAGQDGAQVASINFNDKLGDVRLNLVVPDFRSVEAIRTGLVAAGLEAVTENSNAQGDRVRARLKVARK